MTELRKKKGDTVAVGDVLFAYETDKASFEEEAKVAGQVLEVFFAEGDEIPVLTNVMVIGNVGESVDEFRPGGAAMATAPAPAAAPVAAPAVEAAPAPTVAQAAPAVQAAPAASGKTSPVSPRARALAAKYGVEAAVLAGSGPDGRVISKDVIAAIDTGARTTPLAQAMMTAEGLAAPATGAGLAGAVRGADLGAATAVPATPTGADSIVKPLSNMRKLIAKAMHASLQNSAQLTHHLGADARRIMALRKQAKAFGANITINDLVCFAVIKALQQFPQVNSHFLGDSTRIFNKVHLGLAVDTERGLMVPAVKNASDMTIAQLSAELKKVAEACKGGSVNPDLLSPEAASFTVSNLGAYGVEIFTPVINLPQAAILGVNTIVPRPKDLGEGVYGFVPYIGLSLTYDHRALDGGEATRFLKQIAIEIENLEITF
jgi:pyruvate dehydrogenase E2 component (dihydrolipoamide acetyltransferase)